MREISQRGTNSQPCPLGGTSHFDHSHGFEMLTERLDKPEAVFLICPSPLFFPHTLCHTRRGFNDKGCLPIYSMPSKKGFPKQDAQR